MIKKTYFWVGIAIVAIVFYLNFNLVSNIYKFKDIDSNIKNTILCSLDIEYNHRTTGLENVFTSEFKVDEYFYKQDNRPFKVLKVNKINETEFDIRIKDKQGEYIQNIHFVKKGNSYLISEILYDI